MIKRYVEKKLCNNSAFTGDIMRRIIKRGPGATAMLNKKATNTSKTAMDKVKLLEKKVAQLEKGLWQKRQNISSRRPLVKASVLVPRVHSTAFGSNIDDFLL